MKLNHNSAFLATARMIHCVGVKGIGLSALAQILQRRGFVVSGSDITAPFPADAALRRAGVRIRRGFSARHIPRACDLVIASNAYLGRGKKRKEVNPEVKEAMRRNIPVVSYPDVVAELFNGAEKGIAISGSHGKSTVSALLAVSLAQLREDPSAIVGAVVKNWNTNARISRMQRGTFVVEADEYRRVFLQYHPFGAVITSIEWDHPDVYPTAAAYRAAFHSFARLLPPEGFLVAAGDEPAMARVFKGLRVKHTLTYGFRPWNTLRILATRQTVKGIAITLTLHGRALGSFRTALFGRHHAYNIAATVGTLIFFGCSIPKIRKALLCFLGTKRRFEIIAPKGGATRVGGTRPIIIDDYAHHPTEVAATIATARDVFPHRRILVLFQPHTFSRTEAFFSDFIRVLKTADVVTLLCTYGSARERKGGKRAEDLARALGARYFASHRRAAAYFRANLRARDVLLVIGAGDGDRVARTLARAHFTM